MFDFFLTRPLFNALIYLYGVLPVADLGVAIILLTIIIKLVLWPLTGASLKGQKSMQALQPKIGEIKQRLKDDKEGQAKAIMALYKEEKVNPLSSCLPVIVQIPILLGLYWALSRSMDSSALSTLYSFVPRPEALHTIFIGLIDLAKTSWPLALLAGAAQYVQAKMMIVAKPPKSVQGASGTKDEEMTAMMTKSMTYMMPVVTVMAGFSLPAGITLYWFVSTLVGVLQQAMIIKKNKAV